MIDDLNEVTSSIADVLALMAYVDAPMGETITKRSNLLVLWYEVEEEATECANYFNKGYFNVYLDPHEERGGYSVTVYPIAH